MATPLDIFAVDMPSGMRSYLRAYGYNFAKKACDFAIGRLKRVNPATGKKETVEPLSKEAVEEMLKKQNIKLEHNEGHNFVYLANYIKAKYWKSSIEDEAHMAKMVKDIIDDADCPGGCIFRKWLSECDETGTLIDWDEIL